MKHSQIHHAGNPDLNPEWQKTSLHQQPTMKAHVRSTRRWDSSPLAAPTPALIADTMNFENPGGTVPPQQQKHMKNQPCTATAPYPIGYEVASTQTIKPPARQQLVSALISLPEGSRVCDVANVIGVLSGLPVDKGCGPSGPCWYVPGVSVSLTCSPGGADIEIMGRLVDGLRFHGVTYWFDYPSGSNMPRIMSPPSTPYWLAVGQGLIKAFGGRIKFRSDMPCGHMAFPTPYSLIESASANSYRAYQERLYSIKPITAEQIKEMRSYAAYPDVGR